MTKITAKSALTEPASGDITHIVDVSDTTDDAAGTSKKITMDNLSKAINPDNMSDGSTNVMFTATDNTKLDGIEASADVTDTANVTSAGALMDSEVTNLAQVKAFSSADYATAAQGSTADSALQNVVEDTTPQLGGDLDANGKNIDITPTAGGSDHTTSGITATFTANENQAIGDVCYINTDGEMQLGDADAVATSAIVGMCADATISADAAGTYLLQGFIRDDTWAWTVGGLIYLTVTGTSANTLSQTAPSGANDTITVVGVATHADRMYFNPQLVLVEHTG